MAAAAAIRSQPNWAGASSRLMLGDGMTLAIHASAVSQGNDAVAVIVERARPAEVSAMLVDAYGLTPRQRDVLGQILLGRSMTKLAHSLGISEHTLRIIAKRSTAAWASPAGSELAALLQFEQYDPKVWSDVPPSPYGGFLG